MDPLCHSAAAAATAAVRVITKDTRVRAPTHDAALSAFIPASCRPQGRGLDSSRSAGVVNLTPFQPITILSSRLCKVSLFRWLLETGVIDGVKVAAEEYIW